MTDAVAGGGSPRTWLTQASRHWGRVVTLGVFDLIGGIVAVTWPGITLLVLAIVLGISLLLSAVGSLAIGFRGRNGWMIALGALTLIAAIVVLLHPGSGIWVIAFMATLYFLFSGIADLTLAFTPGPGRVMWGILGVVSLVGAIIMLANPWVAALTVAVVVGVTWIVRGAGEIATGLWLRNHRDPA